MKRKLLLLTVLLSAMTAWADVEINETNFPDENFRNYLLSQEYGADGILTDEEIAGVTELYLSSRNIQSLKGIEYFTALTMLYCLTNQLTSLDVSKNTALTSLDCGVNQLTSLDVSKNTALTSLDCGVNQLTSLDVSKNTALTSLNCGGNLLTSLDVSQNTALITLSCYGNLLTSLDVSKNTALISLSCFTNNLTELNLSKNTELQNLYCGENPLKKLDISDKAMLASLNCNICTQLTELNLYACFNLRELYLNKCPLTSLDLSNCSSLKTLYLSENQLTTLDLSRIQLESLTLNNNPELMASLDLSNQRQLRSLSCSNNQLTSLDVSKNTKLMGLVIYQNQIKGEGMDALIKSMPTLNNGMRGSMVVHYGEDEGNEMTPEQVAAAKAKGWDTYSFDGSNYQEYEGSEEPVSEGIAIDETNFPDENFRNLLLSWYEGADGVLTDREIALAKYLIVNNKNIRSLKGIEFFTALTELNCSFNQLTELDLSKNTALKYLDCSENYSFTTLDLSKNTELTYLNCSGNILTTLDLSKNTELTYLNCGCTELKELNISGCDKLTEFLCMGTQIKELDLSNNTALKKLYFYDNQLTTFDVSNNTALELLQCDRNQLTELDVSKCTKLTLLSCTGNQLRTLDVSNNKSLKNLYFYDNQIKGEGMDALVESLLVISNGRLYAISDENEQNVMTKAQVVAAKEKGWTVYNRYGQEYAGSDPEPVIIAEETTVNPSETAESGQATTTESGVTTSLGDEDVVDATEGSVTMTSSMTTESVKELIETTQPGSSYFNETFKGFYFLLAAGKGKVEFDIETSGGYSLGVMKGTELVGVYTQSTKGTVTIPYDLEEDTWFFAYPVVNTPAAANRAAGDGALKVYGLRIIPEESGTPDGINNLALAFAKGNGVVYNLQGQRTDGLQKGLNIVDGKKVMVK